MRFFLVSSYLSGLTSASVLFAPEHDPCVRLCEEFRSERRGAGVDLCDSREQSVCGQLDVCSNLYWSTSEDGGNGLIYSVDRSELLEDEISKPVSCIEAEGIVVSEGLHKFFHHGLSLFANLRHVQEFLRNQNTGGIAADILEYLSAPLQTLARPGQLRTRRVSMTVVRRIASQLIGLNRARSALEVVELLAVMTNTTRLFVSDHHRFGGCLVCGTQWTVHNDYPNQPRARRRWNIGWLNIPNEPIPTLSEILRDDLTAIQQNDGVCHGPCGNGAPIVHAHILEAPAPILVINYPFDNPPHLYLPWEIDMAPYIGLVSHDGEAEPAPLMYRFSGLAQTTPIAEQMINGSLYVVTESLLIPSYWNTSNERMSVRMQTVFYERV